MDYLPNLAAQTREFLLCLGFGFALGILYDVFRVLRLLAGKSGAAALLAQDLLYSLLCTVLTFFFFLNTGDGILRAYGLLGEILGWLIYYFSLGAVALRCSEWIVKQLRRATRAFVRIMRTPFLRLLRLLEKIANLLRKSRLKLKILKKNLHLGLHSSPKLLYNGRQEASVANKEAKRRAK